MKKSFSKVLTFLIIILLILSSCTPDVGVDKTEITESANNSTLNSSVAPESITAPELTIIPEQTANPETTVTLKPTVTPEPMVTPEPSATPILIATPDPSVIPEPTVNPEVSATAEPTSVPEPSTSTEPTSAPESTAAPVLNAGGLRVEYLTTPIPMTVENMMEYMPYLNSINPFPDLVGRRENEAIEILNEKSFADCEVIYEYNEYFTEGVVYQQSIPGFIDIKSYLDGNLSWNKTKIWVSLGPVPTYHNELVNLCERKGWPVEMWPYIIASGKTIINNILFDGKEVLSRMNENINDIILLGKNESAMVQYKGVYNTVTRDISINSFRVNESTFTHEILHALSNDIQSGKIGLSPDGESYIEAVEAYTDYLADMKFPISDWSNFIFEDELETLLITSDVHMCNGPYNLYLQLYSPMFQLAGDKLIMDAFFGSQTEYETVQSKFNGKYGEGKWQLLLDSADEFWKNCTIEGFEAALASSGAIRNYYAEIYKCLETEVMECSVEAEALRLMVDRIESIEGSFPLAYEDYRRDFYNLKLSLVDKYNEIALPRWDYTMFGMIKFADVNFSSAAQVLSVISNQAAAEKIYIELSKFSTVEKEYQANEILIKNPRSSSWNSPGRYEMQVQPTSLNCEYLVRITLPKIVLDGYYVTDDLVTIFESSRLNFQSPHLSGAVKYLKDNSVDYEIRFLEVKGLDDENNGRLVEQFPGPGVAIRNGGGMVILTFLKKIGN